MNTVITTLHEAELRSPASRAAVAKVRHRVEEQLAAWEVEPETCATAALIVSELLTNALSHGRAREFVLRLELGDLLRIECDDPAVAAYPRRKARRGDQVEAGNGLNLIDALATQWGYVCGASKTVYATLTPDSGRDAADA